MTLYSDNIYSGSNSITSAKSSRSPVQLCKVFNFSAAAGSSTLNGTFPSGTQNLAAQLFITAQGSATSSDKITVSAGGTDLITITSFGSASGFAVQTTTAVATFTVVASACAAPPIPSPNDHSEIPFAVTYLKSSANKTGSCQLTIQFNRVDTAFRAPGVVVS